jgi:hypothetical protein
VLEVGRFDDAAVVFFFFFDAEAAVFFLPPALVRAVAPAFASRVLACFRPVFLRPARAGCFAPRAREVAVFDEPLALRLAIWSPFGTLTVWR